MSFASILSWEENKSSILASEKQSCWHRDPVQILGHISLDCVHYYFQHGNQVLLYKCPSANIDHLEMKLLLFHLKYNQEEMNEVWNTSLSQSTDACGFSSVMCYKRNAATAKTGRAWNPNATLGLRDDRSLSIRLLEKQHIPQGNYWSALEFNNAL